MDTAPAPDHFIDVIAPAVRQAAAVARALEGRVRNRPKTGEARAAKAALTLADSAAQEAILVPLLEHFPDVALRAEEDTPTAASFAEGGAVVVVIDPIDGTLHSYLEGRGPYAVMVGLCVRGRYEAALVALPREGLFFDAVRGGPARKTRPRGEPRPVRAEADGRRVIVSHEMPDAVLARLRERGFAPSFGCGGAISVAPLVPGVCGGVRLATSSEGISIRGRIGLVIAVAAGARAATDGGDAFPDSLDTPADGLVVVADPDDVEPLRWALSAAL